VDTETLKQVIELGVRAGAAEAMRDALTNQLHQSTTTLQQYAAELGQARRVADDLRANYAAEQQESLKRRGECLSLYAERDELRAQLHQERDEAAAEASRANLALLETREALRGLRASYDALSEEAGQLRKQLADPVQLIHVALKLLGVSYEYDAGQWVLGDPCRSTDDADQRLCSALDELDPNGDTAAKATRTC
jgi:uncharacterized coiled-coil DUF342 family protein